MYEALVLGSITSRPIHDSKSQQSVQVKFIVDDVVGKGWVLSNIVDDVVGKDRVLSNIVNAMRHMFTDQNKNIEIN